MVEKVTLVTDPQESGGVSMEMVVSTRQPSLVEKALIKAWKLLSMVACEMHSPRLTGWGQFRLMGCVGCTVKDREQEADCPQES